MVDRGCDAPAGMESKGARSTAVGDITSREFGHPMIALHIARENLVATLGQEMSARRLQENILSSN